MAVESSQMGIGGPFHSISFHCTFTKKNIRPSEEDPFQLVTQEGGFSRVYTPLPPFNLTWMGFKGGFHEKGLPIDLV